MFFHSFDVCIRKFFSGHCLKRGGPLTITVLLHPALLITTAWFQCLCVGWCVLALLQKLIDYRCLFIKVSGKSIDPIITTTDVIALSWPKKTTVSSITTGAKSQSARGQDVIKQHPGNYKHEMHIKKQDRRARSGSIQTSEEAILVSD